MLVFARHAERGDNQFPKQLSEIQYDPPITLDSSATIKQTADELIEIFRANKVTKIQIISSKFLRCLMTSQQLLEHFEKAGFEISQPRIASNEITEYMREDWFSSYPLNSLIFDTPNIEKYVKRENWKEMKLQQPHPFPENYVLFHKRIEKYRQKLTFPKEGECKLLVTHGFVVRQLCWRMNQVPNYAAEIKYCGYAAFKFSGNQEYLLKSKL